MNGKMDLRNIYIFIRNNQENILMFVFIMMLIAKQPTTFVVSLSIACG